ncbi:MAG: triphosphoribosyl-dephospho-CoA synthase [Pirellulales bacterium]
MNQNFSIGQCATLACLWEVTIPKPGNVHRGADFEDLNFADFLASAVAIAPAMNAAPQNRIGQTVLNAVRATQGVVSTNTNLGTVLLLAPLATVSTEISIETGLSAVLSDLEADDAILVYRAIQESGAGGLGSVESMDVAGEPPTDLLVGMQAAAEYDLVAQQYVNGFQQILQCVCPWIIDGINRGWNLAESVVHAHVRLMSEFPDSLIRRKCGAKVADESAVRAAGVLDAGEPRNDNYRRALNDVDFWLRADGHRRNPGTTADIIAAGLFLLIREGVITTPLPRVF